MLLSCNQYIEDLSALLDEQLDEDRKSEVTGHLADCSQCRSQLDQMRSLSRFVSGGLQGEPQGVPDIWGALAGRLPPVCTVIDEDLSAYIDGELTGPAQEGINQHLADCQPCRAKFKELNSTTRLIAGAMELPADHKIDIWAAVKSRLNEDCALIQSEISAYVDQEVATLRHRAITTHLLECLNCRGQFDQLARVGETIRIAYLPDIPDGFDLWPEVKAKLQVVPFTVKARPKPAAASHRLYLVGAVAVVAGVIGSLAYFVFGGGDTVIRPVSAEAYLLESTLAEPGDSAEEVVYENQ